MKKQYFITMFFVCFCVWTILVDNAIMPKLNELKQDVGAYSRYRVKHWNQGGRLDFISDELLIYAIVDNREQLYYMEYKRHFEETLKQLPDHAPVQLRYVRRFPKFWKRQLYDLRIGGQSVVSYSAYNLQQKQEQNWKITGIMGGVYLFLVVLGLINRPRSR
jgi:hypothetical protein